MKLGHVVLALLIFAAGAYWVYDVYTQQENRIRELEGQLRALRAGPRAETVEPKRLVCPACHGEGQLMVRLAGGQDKPYACPVCGSLGRRAAPLPGDAQTCADCRGMGKRPYSMKSRGFVPFDAADNQGERLVARPCMRCGGTGCLRVPPAK